MALITSVGGTSVGRVMHSCISHLSSRGSRQASSGSAPAGHPYLDTMTWSQAGVIYPNVLHIRLFRFDIQRSIFGRWR